MKARISFDLDLEDFPGIDNDQSLRSAIMDLVIEPARKAAVGKVHEARKSDMPQSDKAVAMALPMLGMALTMALASNMDVSTQQVA